MNFYEDQIVLDSLTGIYYSGQTVSGRLKFYPKKEKSYRGIYVTLKGFCDVHWSTQHGRSKREYNAHEQYVCKKIYLVGSDHGNVKIPPGHYVYPFNFGIPVDCPSSYEGKYGHIRYHIKAEWDRAFKLNQKIKMAIQVIAPLNLNMLPGIKNPVHMTFDETYYCCCIRSGSVRAIVKLPCIGFVPGQIIPVEVSAENTGSVSINSIVLKIEKKTKFRAKGIFFEDTKSQTEVLGRISLGRVLANTSDIFTVRVTIPQTKVVNLRKCRYIDMDYRFQVTLIPDGCNSDSSQSQSIVLGTIPLVGSGCSRRGQEQIAHQNAPMVNQPRTSSSPEANSTPPLYSPPPPYSVISGAFDSIAQVGDNKGIMPQSPHGAVPFPFGPPNPYAAASAPQLASPGHE